MEPLTLVPTLSLIMGVPKTLVKRLVGQEGYIIPQTTSYSDLYLLEIKKVIITLQTVFAIRLKNTFLTQDFT